MPASAGPTLASATNGPGTSVPGVATTPPSMATSAEGNDGVGWGTAGQPGPDIADSARPASQAEARASGRAPAPRVSPAASELQAQRALRAVMDSLQSTADGASLSPPTGAMNVALLPHQRAGLAWMVQKEVHGYPRGGILADDQGLGKTVTALAVVVTHRPPPDWRKGTGPLRRECSHSEGTPSHGAVEGGAGVAGLGPEGASCGGRADRSPGWPNLGPSGPGDGDGSPPGPVTGHADGRRPTEEFSAASAPEGEVESMSASVATVPSTAEGRGGGPGSVRRRGGKGGGGDGEPAEGTGRAAKRLKGGAEDGDSGTPGSVEIVAGKDGSSEDVVVVKGARGGVAGAGAGAGAGARASAVEDRRGPARRGGASEVLVASRATSDGTSSEGWGAEGCRRAGTLVVCPTTVLQQWLQEFRDKVSFSAGLSAYIYHGASRMTDEARLSKYDVVITTYSILTQQLPHEGARSRSAEQASGQTGGAGAGGRGGGRGRGGRGRGGAGASRPDLLFSLQWFRVILDEAQLIKNPKTLVSRAACALRAEHRWCLSGTPIQNSVDELQSFFSFLRLEPYSDPSSFRSLVRDPISADPTLGMRRLSAILQGVVLRRTKATRIDGEPIVPLPPRTTRRVLCDPTDGEQRAYQDILSDSQARIRDLAAYGSGNSYANMLLLMLRLRQCCDHPWLAAPPPHLRKSRVNGKDLATATRAARKLPAGTLSRMAAALRQVPAQCAVCGDVAEDPLAARCAHVFCEQCAATSLGGSTASADAAFPCPTCGAPLHAAELLPSAAVEAAAEPAATRAAADASAPASALAPQPLELSAKMRELLSILRRMRSGGRAGAPGEDGRAAGAGAIAGPGAPARAPPRAKSAARLAGAMRKLPPPPPGAHAPSSAPGGPGAAGGKPPSKAIVFSQWTSMLDLVEVPLTQAGFRFRRLDGSMTVAQRDKALEDFRTDPTVEVMLMSLKAAALGLNLVAADHVVLLDPWFNPTVEEQAIDRAHRIGQTREVHVARLLVRGTVEERIAELQETKLEMARAALGEGESATLGFKTSELTMEDLKFLFNIS